MIQLKRIYEPPGPEDGFRILVERLWARGLTKEKAEIDLWLKEISPSPELRKWFSHDPEKWPEFQKRYWAELEANEETVRRLEQVIADKEVVTLVYAAKDEEHNSARLLKEYLERRGHD